MTTNEQISARVERAQNVAGKARDAAGRLDPATVRKYRRAWKQYEGWRRECGLTVVTTPTTSETLAVYAAELLEQGYAKATVDGRLSAIKAIHRERGWPVPDGVAAWYVLRGGEHTPRSPVRGRTPPDRRGVVAAAQACVGLPEVAAVRDRCVVTLWWALLAREKDLVAVDIEDVAHTGMGLRVRLAGRWLDVDHDHEPVQACPVCATEHWLRVLAGQGAAGGPLLRSVDKGQNIGGCGPKAGPVGVDGRLNVRGLQRVWARLNARMATAGFPAVEPRDVRIAAAVAAVQAGADVADVMRRGGWSPQTLNVVRRLLTAAMPEQARTLAQAVAGGE